MGVQKKKENEKNQPELPKNTKNVQHYKPCSETRYEGKETAWE